MEDNILSGTTGGYGGGICALGSGSLTVANSSFDINEARYGAGIYVGANIPFNVSGSVFSGNLASVAGGGIYLNSASSGSSSVSGCEFMYNEGYDAGGAIYSNRPLVLEGATDIHHNSANGTSGKGGGVYIGQQGGITYTNVLIGHNTASSGTGVYRYLFAPSSGSGVTWYGSPANSETTGY